MEGKLIVVLVEIVLNVLEYGRGWLGLLRFLWFFRESYFYFLMISIAIFIISGNQSFCLLIDLFYFLIQLFFATYALLQTFEKLTPRIGDINNILMDFMISEMLHCILDIANVDDYFCLGDVSQCQSYCMNPSYLILHSFLNSPHVGYHDYLYWFGGNQFPVILDPLLEKRSGIYLVQVNALLHQCQSLEESNTLLLLVVHP